jgi:phosphoglucosamine mutase
LGRAARLTDAAGRYIEGAKATFPRGQTLDGLKIVVDCANGAGYKVAPTVLWELGATVIPLGVNPDGFNINQGCGSTEPQHLCAEVVRQGADLGLALDGDADRLLLSDERGKLIDGDQILALTAKAWRRRSCPISGSSAIWPGWAWRCTAPASATATWSSACAPTA